MTQDIRPISVLFITPSFNRTGSEVLLLNLIKGIDKELITPYLYCLGDGELLKELPAGIPYYLPYYTRRKRSEKLWRSILKRAKIDPFLYQLKAIQHKINADVWYINTIVVDPRVFIVGKQLGVKIVTHFHELSNAYRFISKNHLQLILENSDTCIGCSKIVCEKIRELGHQDVRLQYSFIDTDLIDQQLSKSPLSKQLLGIPEDAFIWAISGTMTYEKGVDYLPLILAALETENIFILWLGKSPGDGLGYYIETITNQRWPGKVMFTGGLKDEYYQYLMLADGLLMPSREDSFSLVMLEAAYLGKPIVSFNSGGVKEFVDENRGVVVDSWNAIDLAVAMKEVKYSTKKNWSINSISEFTLSYQIKHFQMLIAKQG